MEPALPTPGLAPATTIHPLISLAGERRSHPSQNAPEKQRPVELLPDRVEAGDLPDESGSARRAGEESARTLGAGGAPRDEEESSQTKEISELLAAPDFVKGGIAPKNQAIVYRLFPELRIHFQGQVIDRGTSETLYSVPSDQRIELYRRFEEHLGNFLDTHA